MDIKNNIKMVVTRVGDVKLSDNVVLGYYPSWGVAVAMSNVIKASNPLLTLDVVVDDGDIKKTIDGDSELKKHSAKGFWSIVSMIGFPHRVKCDGNVLTDEQKLVYYPYLDNYHHMMKARFESVPKTKGKGGKKFCYDDNDIYYVISQGLEVYDKVMDDPSLLKDYTEGAGESGGLPFRFFFIPAECALHKTELMSHDLFWRLMNEDRRSLTDEQKTFFWAYAIGFRRDLVRRFDDWLVKKGVTWHDDRTGMDVPYHNKMLNKALSDDGWWDFSAALVEAGSDIYTELYLDPDRIKNYEYLCYENAEYKFHLKKDK